MGLRVAEFPTGQIRRVAADRPAKVPQVDADLIGTAGERNDFEQ